MDIGSSFTFMFSDPESVRKLGIGTAIALVSLILSPVLIGLIGWLIIGGYTLSLIRNVLDGRTVALPEWDDWGGFLARGFKLAAAFFVWSLPLIVVMIPLVLGAAMVDNDNSATIPGTLLIVCGSCLSFLWGVFLALVTPAIYARLARTDRFASAFDLAKLWAFTRDNIGNVIIVILLGIVAALIASIAAMLGVIAVVIGLLVTVPLASLWQMLVQAHLYAQVALHSVTPIE